MTPTIRTAIAGDAPLVAAVIAEAFHPLAVARWLVPDDGQRFEVLAADFHILVGHALAHGHVHMATGAPLANVVRMGGNPRPWVYAVAVWFPRDGDPLPEPADYRERLVDAVGEAAGRFLALDELFDKHHPAEPHHHLAFLAVQPDLQGRGLGTALLEHHHMALAADVPAYLEATSEDARRLYERHGYRAGEPFHLPNGTPIWPMWREPKPEGERDGR